jgi:YgiT-type zinc finger domain-containing protein
MNCILCKSNLIKVKVKVKVNHTVDLDSHSTIIKNVPASICNQCGEYFIEDDVAIKLEKMIEAAVKNRTEIFVMNYSESSNIVY